MILHFSLKFCKDYSVLCIVLELLDSLPSGKNDLRLGGRISKNWTALPIWPVRGIFFLLPGI
jgi:hypothetical protein